MQTPTYKKLCTGCGKKKPYTKKYFHVMRTTATGVKLSSRCKACRNEERKKYKHTYDYQERKHYQKARARALTQLARMYPEQYQTILDHELRRERFSVPQGEGQGERSRIA